MSRNTTKQFIILREKLKLKYLYLKLKAIKLMLNCIEKHKCSQNVCCPVIIAVMFRYILYKCLS
jgi:hypothetical protein